MREVFSAISKKKKLLKRLFTISVIFCIILTSYLVFLPLYPLVKYQWLKLQPREKLGNVQFQSDLESARKTSETGNGWEGRLPEADISVSADRLIIPKIGVNAPIVEAENEDIGLSRGAWRVPDSSTPDKGGNTVISGHRFKYLPPNNLTFYLLDKMAVGDDFFIYWHGQTYQYQVAETKIVANTDFSILQDSKIPTVTLFTCHPLYSTTNRLVVVGHRQGE